MDALLWTGGRGSRGRASALTTLASLALALTLSFATGCSDDEPSQDADADADAQADGDLSDAGDTGGSSTYQYAVPLDDESPWPKFRRNAQQTGRSTVMPVDSGADVWVFQTGKGIFSTPVIDGDDNVYIGSADRSFYAIDSSGSELWSFLTGEIIDSSALLDDQGHVYFGSGDGFVYALDRETGDELWSFEADAASVTGAFINWFEGNVAMRGDGALIVPNDNFRTYAIDRDAGTELWHFTTQDQTWSLAAYNAETDSLFMGNNFFFLENTFAIDASDGEELWNSGQAQGTVAASPMLTSTGADGLVVIGGFDGILRAYEQSSGDSAWTFGARDHLYASPAQAADGTIIQPSADGTIYAVDPEDGSMVWAYDTREPIRSSPAIDGAGNIYVGSGEGRLFVLNPDGTLRWSIQLIDDQRDDLNASPALGESFVAVAGENGGVFAVPYDYCLRDGLDDGRCTVGPGEALDDDGVFLVVTTHFGGLLVEPPEEIVANEPLTFSLFVREDGDTTLALIDSNSVDVTVSSGDVLEAVSGDRKFVTLIPEGPWAGGEGGTLTVRIEGDYLVDFERNGLNFSEGTVGGSFDETFTFDVTTRTESDFPLPVADAPGDETGIVELYRLAAPLPTILPSYNQIGFDSIHYLIGVVEGSATDEHVMVGWGIGGTLDDNGDTVVDPGSDVRFPLSLVYDDGSFTMINNEGFTIEFNGFPLPFAFFRVATEIDDEANALFSPFLNARAICGEIDFYGQFLQLLGFCNPDTDLLDAVGGAELRPHEGGSQSAPTGVGTVSFALADDEVTATLTGSELVLAEHNLGILLIDGATGIAVPINYTTGTDHTAGDDGVVETVVLDVGNADLPANLRVYLMVDTYPAVVDTLSTE